MRARPIRIQGGPLGPGPSRAGSLQGGQILAWNGRLHRQHLEQSRRTARMDCMRGPARTAWPGMGCRTARTDRTGTAQRPSMAGMARANNAARQGTARRGTADRHGAAQHDAARQGGSWSGRREGRRTCLNMAQQTPLVCTTTPCPRPQASLTWRASWHNTTRSTQAQTWGVSKVGTTRQVS